MPPVLSTKKALYEWKLYLFVLPTALMIATFAYWPAGSAVYHSVFDWKGGEAMRFIGFANFIQAFRDPVFWQSFKTIGILVAANVLKLVPSIFLAVLIHRLRGERSQYWYRVGVVLPMIVPALVTLFVWKFFFDANLGPLNKILDASGLKSGLVWLDTLCGWGVFKADLPISWLGQPELIIPSLILWGFPWIGAVGVLIYLAGLQSIGQEVYEAADIDGVTGWQKFRHIEFPLIMTQVRLTLVLLIIQTLQGFGLQLMLLGENGGAGGRGMVPGLWMYNRAFAAGQFGYACALGLILFLVILALTAINNRFVRVQK
jgi:ABC-type sugar transport system permease subunit